MARRIVIVLVTCPSPAVGRRLAKALVQRKLAACVNVVPGIESHYRWQGKLERAAEVLLLIKTTAGRFAALQRAVRALHPYKSPEIIALPVTAGYHSYLQWVAESVS